MSLIKQKRVAEDEVGVSTGLNISHLVTSRIFETQDNMLGCVMKIKGVPFITATDEDLNTHQHMVHQALLKLNHEFVLYAHMHRCHKEIALEGDFSSKFAEKVDKKYHRRFKEQSLYVNEHYLTLMFKNEQVATGKKSVFDKVISLYNRMNDSLVVDAIERKREYGVKVLMAKARELAALLDSFDIKLLGENDDKLGYSELLSFLSIVPNGGRDIKLFKPTYPAPSSKSVRSLEKELLRYPEGNLGQYLCNKRIFFGDNIQFQGNTKEDVRFATMLSLKQYSRDSSSVSLDPLFNIEGEFVLTQSFSPVETQLAIKEVERCHSMKVSADDYSASQIEELGTLADLVASEKVRCGFHHSSLMLMADSNDSLESLVNEATKAYSLANMGLVRETLAQTPTFFAQVPGNGCFIARSSMITSENFADFCSFHNTQSGHHKSNFLDSAVTLFETPSKTPVFGNYHDKGSKTNPSRGQALIIGGNDSGKTTTATFIDAQMDRFKKHRSIFLDRNDGTKIYILAMGGKYISIDPNHKTQCQMNPLCLEDTELNRDFAKSWFEALILREGESSLPSQLSVMVSDTVDYCFDSLEPKVRTLSNVSKFFPVNFDRWPELYRWLKGDDSRNSGKYAWVFDNDEDTLSLDARHIGFDITYVLDRLNSIDATPIFMYMMHRIELSLSGDVTSIVIDEFWQVLREAYWKQWLEQRLPSIRKEGGHVVGMTQSPKTIVQSSIAAELLDNVATLILFPNPKADKCIYVDHLGLSEAEFSFIKNNSPSSRLFLYKHDKESVVCKLDLSELSDEIRVFSGNKKSVALLENIISEVGDDPDTWLPIFIERSKS